MGSAKSHTINLSNTRGDIIVDTGVRVVQSFIIIKETFGDIDLTVGTGQKHNISLANTEGAASLNIDLGEKTISAFNTTGSLSIKHNKGNDQIAIDKANGNIDIESGDGSHMYTLSQTNGMVDIIVGNSDHSDHLFNLTNIDGTVSITAGDGDCVINGYEMTGEFSGVLGNGNDDINLVNTAANIQLRTGNGDRSITAVGATSFMALLGDGNDDINLHSSGAIHIQSGDGIHNATFESTAGSIDVDVGRAVGRGKSQLLTIVETIGNINLKTGDGDQNIIIENTSDGNITVDTGKRLDFGIFDIHNTTNGDVSILSRGGPSTVEIFYTAGDVNIDMIGTGIDNITLFEIGGSIDVNTWDDSDIVFIDKLSGNLMINTGDGDDLVYIYALGGNGTLFGGVGDDLLVLDPRDMDSVHLNWYAGDGNNTVEMYLRSSGPVHLYFYIMNSDQIFTRCSYDGTWNPLSFSSGLELDNIPDSTHEYLFINADGCCNAYFSWDALCGGRRAQQNGLDWSSPTSFWHYPKFDESTCYKKPSSDFDPDETEKYPTKTSCCVDKFESDVLTCCRKGDGECAVSGVSVYIPDFPSQTCKLRDSALVSGLESDSTSNTVEECCKKCKYHES